MRGYTIRDSSLSFGRFYAMLWRFSLDKGMTYGAGKNPLRAAGRTASPARFRIGRGPVSRRPSGAIALLHGSDAGDDLRPTHPDAPAFARPRLCLKGAWEDSTITAASAEPWLKLSGRRQRIRATYRIFRDVALCMIAAARQELPVDPELQALGSRDLCPRCHHHRLVP